MTRFSRARELHRLGVRSLDRTQWAAVVDAAAQKTEDSNRALWGPRTFTLPSIPSPTRPIPVYLAHDAVMVPTEIVLGVEAALIEAEESLRQIEVMAQADLDSARRARLLEQIQITRDSVARAIRSRGAA